MFLDDENEYRTKVKVCGIKTLEHARFVSGALADFVGFIFHNESPRFIKPEEAGAIITWLEGPKTVGVFVTTMIDDINDQALISGVDYVQLHGDIDVNSCALIEKPIIKVFSVNEHTNLDELQYYIDEFDELCEYYLFDTADDKVAGGTGKQFNWEILKQLTINKPFFLAGGINNENVKIAIKETKPFAVDLSSSLETKPGEKDIEKLSDFFETMNAIWNQQNYD